MVRSEFPRSEFPRSEFPDDYDAYPCSDPSLRDAKQELELRQELEALSSLRSEVWNLEEFEERSEDYGKY